MDDDWDTLSFVLRSDYRLRVLERLFEGPATPSQLATDTGIAITHVSRSLSDLREQEMVELLVSEEQRKGRVYGITERGETVWQRLNAEGLV